MTGMDEDDYATMVEDFGGADPHRGVPPQGRARSPWRAGRPGKLIAAALTDILADGLSMVYSFFEPAQTRRGLGNFIILDHITRATAGDCLTSISAIGCRASAKMSYKARFSPLESLDPEGWVPLETD